MFDSKIETETDSEQIITAVPGNPRAARNPRASGPRPPRSNQVSFNKLGGDYLHFTLYKENKDTMDAINQISRMTGVRANSFGFAGTKDRRAATVQRISALRLRHQTLDLLNSQIPAVKMGDYKYSPYPIELGDHGGNEFKITVKNVTVANGDSCSLERRVQLTKEAVGTAVSEITKYGYINYYGLQRFGTHVVGTHELGKMLLMENYEAVVDGLLHVDGDLETQVISGTVQETPSNRDEISRARAIVQFKTTKDANAALQILPRRFGAETSVIKHLAKNTRDFPGAILTITRGMRNLYLHAYQSYVWNHVASHRWAKYGSQVIPGDLVLTTPENAEGSGGRNATEESDFQRARPLSKEEVDSGKFDIYDIVLPGPGFDVAYPDNDIGEFYVEFMKKPENGGLDPHKMRRSKKEFRVSGSYRHLLGRLKGEARWEVRTYVNDSEQMRPTDRDLIDQRKAAAKAQAHGVSKDDANKVDAAEESKPADETRTDTERRRPQESPNAEPRINEAWVETSEDGSSKRRKFKQDESLPDTSDAISLETPGEGGAPPKVPFPQQPDSVQAEAEQPAKPVRQPTVPNGSTGFDTSADSKVPESVSSKPALDTSTPNDKSASLGAEGPATGSNRHGNAAIKSFVQADLSGRDESHIKIAVILEFGLVQSAYATVVLRELMAGAGVGVE